MIILCTRVVTPPYPSWVRNGHVPRMEGEVMTAIRRFADAITERLVPRANAGACPSCYVAGGCSAGGQDGIRRCCYTGSTCRLVCGCEVY